MAAWLLDRQQQRSANFRSPPPFPPDGGPNGELRPGSPEIVCFTALQREAKEGREATAEQATDGRLLMKEKRPSLLEALTARVPRLIGSGGF